MTRRVEPSPLAVAEVHEVRLGDAEPLGARWDGAGTNVAVWAPRASRVTLCLLDDAGGETRIDLPGRAGGTWHGYLPGVGPGTRYGLRVDGPWDPGAGLWSNPAKRLVDPYALAVDGELVADPAVRAWTGDPDEPMPDPFDSGPFVPAAVVVDDRYDWAGDQPPRVPWSRTVVYELHVRGFTMRHPDVPEHLRGTYAGLAHPAVVAYLTDLGITTVELMPVAAHASEPALLRRGLRNYWGYNPLAPLAPHGGYAAGGTRGEQVRELKDLVRVLHAAGLEVIVDVVLNHTAEGDRDGPVLSLRGLDEAAYYYRDGRGRLVDVTGCGNSLDLSRPAGLRLAMDSLRRWVSDFHVDGFRFDLATTLARGEDLAFERHGAFLAAVGQDPVLRTVKLVAEPWDLGLGGYQLGGFPQAWAEWNDRYRDAVRRFWLAGNRPGAVHPGVREVAYRLAGSSDVFDAAPAPAQSRGPLASVNFVTAHDGATLRDLVSYEGKHNHANGEDNRDGADDSLGWSAGVEGETHDPALLRLRRRLMRTMTATLLVSAGVPMLTAGDELGRTQCGNTNAYAQDNELSWLDWDLASWQRDLHAVTRALLRLRREHPVLRRTTFFAGHDPDADGPADSAWFGPDGMPMDHDRWHQPGARTLSWYLGGDAVSDDPDAPDGTVADRSYLVVLHAGPLDVDVVLPGPPWAEAYTPVLDTVDERPAPAPWTLPGGEPVRRPAFSLAVYEALSEAPPPNPR